MATLDWIEKELENLESKGLLIKFRTIDSAMGPKIKVDGKWVLNFCSNNYLGLANNPKMKKAVKNAINKYGIGPTAVRTIAGTTKLHLELERKLAKFKHAESVITYQSGFNANVATVPALVGEDDVIFSDELNHASIIDACRLSKAEVIRFKHLDAGDLENKLSDLRKKEKEKKVLVITDGVFSMDGDIADLPSLLKVTEKFNTLLMVDDAHGEGVLGKNGAGIVDHFGLHGRVDIEVGTLSKAFGVVGGMVAGKKVLTDWLRQRSRPFLFSSAMTIPDVAACIKAVDILESSEGLTKKLWSNSVYFKEKMQQAGFDTGKSQTPIVPVMLGDALLAREFSQRLFKQGIFAMNIGYPTVPQGMARIRVMISAAHGKSDLDKAISSFKSVGKTLKVVS